MRIFILKIALFAFGLFALAYCLDAMAVSAVRHLQYGGYGVLNRIVDGKINTDIIICGASRAHVQIDPEIIDKITFPLQSFNISQDGEQLRLQLALLKTYLRYNKKPKYVMQILNIRSLTKQEFIINKHKYFPYLNEYTLYEALNRLDPAIWYQKHIPGYSCIRYNKSILVSLIQELRGRKSDYKGFSAKDKQWDNSFEKMKKSNPNGLLLKVDDAQIATLKEIVNLCNNNDIIPILVYPPEYYEALDLFQNRVAIFSHFRQVAEEKHIQFWDYTNSYLSNTKDYFYNSQHLNAEGAKIFSMQLGEKIIEEYIQ